jgi:hypothetical protein
MRRLKRIGRGSLFVVVFTAISFMGSIATAWQVAEFGEAGFLNIDYQVQLREAWRDINADNEKKSVTDTYLRRNRLSFLGAVNETFGGALQFEYNGSRKINDLGVADKDSDIELTVLDVYATATFSNALQFRVGKTKQVLTREIQEGCFDPLTLDRSNFILGPFTKNIWNYNKSTRDNGVSVLGNLFSDVFQYRLAVMEGNKYSGSNAPDNVGYRYTGRVHVSLYDPENGWSYRGSNLGKKKVLTLGAGYEIEPNAVYSQGTTGSENYTAYTLDAFYELPTDSGTYTLSGAYLKADFGNAGTRLVADAMGVNGEKNGGYWKGAYMLGKVQVFGRYEKWSFANLGEVQGQIVTAASEGVNYYINGQKLRLTLEHTRTSFEKASVQGFNTIIAQFQARF